jgi:replicative DNA helicase Mcm
MKSLEINNLDWNRFFYEYYYSNHSNYKKWDPKNDIFSSLLNNKQRIIVDCKALEEFDNNNGTKLLLTLCNGFSKKMLDLIEKELNFEKDVDIKDPSEKYPYSLKKFNYEKDDDKYSLEPMKNIKLNIGFKNFPNKLSLYDTSNHFKWNKLIQVRGIIQSISAPTTYSKRKTFHCTKCHYAFFKYFSIFQKKFKFNSRNFCPYCRTQQKFEEKMEDELNQRVQLVGITEQQTATSTPITLKCIIPEDLIDAKDPEKRKLLPGKEITFVGVLDAAQIPNRIEKLPVINVMFWETLEDDVQLKKKDVDEIIKISKKKNFLKLLVKSLSPSIYGYEKVKEALILQSVGGVRKVLPDKKIKRGSIHILCIGDPSTAKSSLGWWIYNHIPKAKYAVCSETTHAGLGAALLKDKETETWMVTAGVLPLAHKSVAVLDELDKAEPDDIKSLDVVMETQILPVDKAGISIKLPAETSVLAIANPKMARFDPYAEMKDQVSFSEVTLSRFDLKLPFQDIPHLDRDEKIVDKITKKKEKEPPPFTSQFVTKYILHARQFRPELSVKSIELLKKFYLDLRGKSSGKEGILQITPRQFEGLIRLTEAYAKLRLAKITTKGDAKNAIEMFKHYLSLFGMISDTGEIDIDKLEGRTSKETRDRTYRMLEILKDLHKRMDLKNIPVKDFEQACSKKYNKTEIDKWLSKAKSEGMIFESKPGFIAVV